MYRTSAAQYGSRAPSVHTMPTSFHCRSQKFSAVRKSFHRMLTLSKLSRESYMSAHVLLKLLNNLRKAIKCSILSLFPNEFDSFKNTGACSMLDSIYHMTIKVKTTLKWQF